MPNVHPELECSFAETVLGISGCFDSVLDTFDDDARSNASCAERAVELTANGVMFHQIRDLFEPRGDAEYWISKIYLAHERSFAAGATSAWDSLCRCRLGCSRPI